MYKQILILSSLVLCSLFAENIQERSTQSNDMIIKWHLFKNTSHPNGFVIIESIRFDNGDVYVVEEAKAKNYQAYIEAHPNIKMSEQNSEAKPMAVYDSDYLKLVFYMAEKAIKKDW